jgi:tetratricopeptide (TPR) repeat protein
VHKSQGELGPAEAAYRQALDLCPDYVDAWISLGILLRSVGRRAEAEDCQREALVLAPDNHVSRLNLGNVLRDRGAFAEAEACYRAVLEAEPTHAEANNNLGRLLLDRGRHVEAGKLFHRAVRQRPDYAEALEGMGVCFLKGGQFDESIETLGDACRLRPDEVQWRFELATVHLASGNVGAATSAFEELLGVHPDTARVKAGIAAALTRLGQYARPRRLFEEAIGQSPDDLFIHGHYSEFLLRQGEFDRAWPYYEYREHYDPWRRSLVRGIGAPRWRGEPLSGKRLLITAEQGLGDEIMFSSVYGEMLEEAAECLIECDERLERLFRRSFPAATILPVPKSQEDWQSTLERALPALPAPDFWSTCASLPLYRRNGRERFPVHSGYLRASSERTTAWRQRLQELGPGPKIGISWRGGTPVTRAARRSLGVDQLRPILALNGAHFVNLQYGNVATELAAFTAQAGIAIHHWPEAIEDYDETAALVCALDLTVTVCTSIVHLAGSLGRPVWVMAPHVAEWRYGHEGERMIWYPSVRMFRQPEPGAWKPVLSQLRRELFDWQRRRAADQAAMHA